MITVRRALQADLDAIVAVNINSMGVNRDFDEDFVAGFENTGKGQRFFKKLIENKTGCCFVAEELGQVIGYANGVIWKSFYQKKRYTELENIAVMEEFRTKGIGKMLFDAVERWAKEKNCYKLYLSCYAKNTKAMNFYHKQGMKERDIGLEKLF